MLEVLWYTFALLSYLGLLLVSVFFIYEVNYRYFRPTRGLKWKDRQWGIELLKILFYIFSIIDLFVLVLIIVLPFYHVYYQEPVPYYIYVVIISYTLLFIGMCIFYNDKILVEQEKLKKEKKDKVIK